MTLWSWSYLVFRQNQKESRSQIHPKPEGSHFLLCVPLFFFSFFKEMNWHIRIQTWKHPAREWWFPDDICVQRDWNLCTFTCLNSEGIRGLQHKTAPYKRAPASKTRVLLHAPLPPSLAGNAVPLMGSMQKHPPKGKQDATSLPRRRPHRGGASIWSLFLRTLHAGLRRPKRQDDALRPKRPLNTA